VWVIAVIGLVLTAAATWAAARSDENTEKRLLQGQTQQAAAVISTSILSLQQPLSEVLDADRLVPRTGQAHMFTGLMGRHVGAGQQFTSASLWRSTGGRFREVGTVGAAPGLSPGGPAMQAFLRHSVGATSFVVRRVEVGGGQARIAYALADPETGRVVYADRALASDGRARVDRNSAFADLDYAIYLGSSAETGSLATTNVDPSTLPLGGVTSSTTVPFGDVGLTMVMSPRTHLGNPLGQRLPWILLIAGILLTVGACLVARTLVRARKQAEADTATIAGLYQTVDSLYGEQRAVAFGLQHALLPHANPDIGGVEVATEYVAGARGIDIGGDWFSVIGVGEHHYAFVVGDVSGRGVDAVAEMARARFTLRAYLFDGDSPEVGLEKCSRQFDVARDGHIVTVLVGVGHRETGQTTIASAGHLPPLLVSGDGDGPVAEFVNVTPGPPLGAGAASYGSACVTLPAGATLMAYTDGLVERRGEDLAVGMDRLARTVTRSAGMPLRFLVDDVLASMRHDAASDDIAVLALRRASS